MSSDDDSTGLNSGAPGDEMPYSVSMPMTLSIAMAQGAYYQAVTDSRTYRVRCALAGPASASVEPMHTMGRGIRGRLGAALLVLALAGVACGGGGGDHPTPTPFERPTHHSPTPVVIGTADVAAWVAIWKDAFQRFADDVSAVVRSARNQNLSGL